MTATTARWARRRTWVVRYGRKVAVTVLGGAVLVAGIAMLALPGPGIAVCLLGLSILSLEFTWARRAQQRVRMRARAALARARTARDRRRGGKAPRVDIVLPADPPRQRASPSARR